MSPSLLISAGFRWWARAPRSVFWVFRASENALPKNKTLSSTCGQVYLLVRLMLLTVSVYEHAELNTEPMGN